MILIYDKGHQLEFYSACIIEEVSLTLNMLAEFLILTVENNLRKGK